MASDPFTLARIAVCKLHTNRALLQLAKKTVKIFAVSGDDAYRCYPDCGNDADFYLKEMPEAEQPRPTAEEIVQSLRKRKDPASNGD